jgi:hypothetical protein
MSLSELARRTVQAAKVASLIDPASLRDRLLYEAARRGGWLRRRYPVSSFEKWLPSDADQIHCAVIEGRNFTFGAERESWQQDYRRLFGDGGSAVVDADRIVNGKLQYFGARWHDWGGMPDWLLNPFTGERVSRGRHWSSLGFYSPAYGDLKFMLEASRGAWTFPLLRAYWRTGDEKYPDAWWRLIESWMAENPPQAGPMWLCAQESSIRVMAWAFGLFAMAHSPHTTVGRTANLVALFSAHADRISGTLAYGRSQKNNHAINEAVGLLTVGTLFPTLPKAREWRDIGRRELAGALRRQVYADGTYIQHSHNYHRVMMQSVAWAIAISRSANDPLPEEIGSALERAAAYLFRVTDPRTGELPNLGPNDGAHLFPLSDSGYSDYRPAIQAASRISGGEALFESGAWDEESFWLLGPGSVSQSSASASTAVRGSDSFPDGGSYLLRSRDSWALCRAAAYRDRPAHCDQLHVDLWWRGHNIACDAGTYLYNAPPPWDNALAITRVHNTVEVDGTDQMTRAGRFLWLDWAKGIVEGRRGNSADKLEYWEATHDGYRRLRDPVQARRGVLRIGKDHWLVIDGLAGSSVHSYRLQWLLPDFPNAIDLERSHLAVTTPAGVYSMLWGALSGSIESTLLRADANSPRGWRAPYYGFKEAALSVAVVQAAKQTVFWTVFGPAPLEVKILGKTIRFSTGDGVAEVKLGARGGFKLESARWESSQPEQPDRELAG